jgi:hypothetical protein
MPIVVADVGQAHALRLQFPADFALAMPSSCRSRRGFGSRRMTVGMLQGKHYWDAKFDPTNRTTLDAFRPVRANVYHGEKLHTAFSGNCRFVGRYRSRSFQVSQ